MGTFALSKLIGNGEPHGREPLTETTGPYRVPDEVGSHVAVIMTGLDGRPNKFAALIYSPLEESALTGITGVHIIPGASLDDVIGAPTANVFNNRLATYGIPALIVAGMTKLDAINAVGDYLSPGWSYREDTFFSG